MDTTQTLPPALAPALADTNVYRAAAPPSRSRLVVVPGAGANSNRELEAQLRRRLQFVSVLIVGTLAANFFLTIPFEYRQLLATPAMAFNTTPCLGLMLILLVVEFGVCLSLWSPRPAGLARLRSLEVGTFAPLVGYLTWNESLHLAAMVPHLEFGPRMIGSSQAIYWTMLVVGYGVLIPNTWRRCTAVVGVILLFGYVPDVVLILGSGAPTSAAVPYLSQKAIWFVIAGAVMSYGAYRVELLRAESNAARQLGQYILRQHLGSGGMGEVHLAEHLLLRRPCAIKLIRPDHAGDARILARFEREVRTTATLTHPNTVQIYDYGRAEDGTFYYVMEYLPGVTLDELVARDGPLPADRAVRLLRQLCGSLREAHRAGLIHRDIKPGNVMVCERGGVADTVKLLDFGLVRPASNSGDERLTQEGTIYGTPAYLSPEQADGRDNLDARSDVYSLGAVAYFLLAGRAPFAGRSVMLTIVAHLCDPPEPLTSHRPDVPAELEAVVLRCLAKNPADRFPDMDGLDAALAESLRKCEATAVPAEHSPA